MSKTSFKAVMRAHSEHAEYVATHGAHDLGHLRYWDKYQTLRTQWERETGKDYLETVRSKFR